LAERNTFQGERCIYNALTDRIKNLLLQYDYSKATDPLQPWSSHITSLLSRRIPSTSDITLTTSISTQSSPSFHLHKFLLSARTPYFHRKLLDAPETTTWKLPTAIPIESFYVVLRYLYLGDIPRDLVSPNSTSTEEEVLMGIGRISKHLEVEKVWGAILSEGDRRLARQRYQDEVNRAQEQVERFFKEYVLSHKMVIESSRVGEIKWRRDNSIFADCLLRADDLGDDTDEDVLTGGLQRSNSIPIGPAADDNYPSEPKECPRKSTVYPVHKAMLIRSEYFETMFSGSFKEAQDTEHLHIVTVDCTPEVLEIILTFLYTEKVNCPLELALDVLYIADMLFLDKVKNKAAVVISTLGSGNNNVLIDRTHRAAVGEQQNGAAEIETEPINIYDVIHAAWDLRVRRLEEFAARYLAYRLEDYIDEEEFADVIRESADRIKGRQETDTIELLDDIRHYLEDRFRMGMEDAGLEEMLVEVQDMSPELAEAIAAAMNGDADVGNGGVTPRQEFDGPGVRTLDGALAEDEFLSDAINHRILLNKIDAMLERLKLDA
jgi:ankyrin repeat and BTB/POZ domain-containing protein 1